MYFFFFFKQKTAYEMRISDWSSDVCSSDLAACRQPVVSTDAHRQKKRAADGSAAHLCSPDGPDQRSEDAGILFVADEAQLADAAALDHRHDIVDDDIARIGVGLDLQFGLDRRRLGLFEIDRELRDRKSVV